MLLDLWTANMSNLPNMTRPAMRAGLVKIRDHARPADVAMVAGFQEMIEPNDDRDLHSVFPQSRFGHFGWDSENPQVFDKRQLRRLRTTVELRELVPDHQLSDVAGIFTIGPGRDHVQPHHTLTWCLYAPATPEVGPLRPFGVVCWHGTPGAFTHPGQPGDADGWRIDHWHTERAEVLARAAWLNHNGLDAIVLGDTNNPKLTAGPWPAGKILSGSGFDWIELYPTRAPGRLGNRWTVLEREPMATGSDHKAQRVRVSVEAARPAVTVPRAMVSP